MDNIKDKDVVIEDVNEQEQTSKQEETQEQTFNQEENQEETQLLEIDCENSPFVENVVIDQTNEQNNQQNNGKPKEDNKQILQDLKRLYSDRHNVLNKILKLYKVLTLDLKTANDDIWSKTEQDVLNDVYTSNYNLNLKDFVKDSYTKTLANKYNNDLVINKTKIIPVLLDFCWVYYVHYFDPNAPFYVFPRSVEKMNVLLSYLPRAKPDNERVQAIRAIYVDVINSKTFKEMRTETPPYYITAGLEIEEIEKLIRNDVMPFFKDLLGHIIYINDDRPIPKKETNDVKTREDNLQNQEVNQEISNIKVDQPKEEVKEEVKEVGNDKGEVKEDVKDSIKWMF